jgi:hypothetical protein
MWPLLYALHNVQMMQLAALVAVSFWIGIAHATSDAGLEFGANCSVSFFLNGTISHGAVSIT